MKRILCLVLISLMIFSACSNDTGENGGIEKEAKAENQTITIYSLKDDTLCPILTDNGANRQMLGLIFESLVYVNDNMEAEGVLATDWTESDNGIEWAFNLRKDARWHSGESLTAQDVLYTVNQIKANIGGPYEYNVRHIVDARYEGSRIVFVLDEPCANFVNLMTFPVIKQQDEEIDKISYIPCGTGAYIFSDKNEGNMYYLKRNENWWGKKGNIEEIRVKLLPDRETVMYSFSSGDVDIATTERGNIGRFAGDTEVKSSICYSTVYDFLGINHNNILLAQTEIRTAMDSVVKRQKIIDDIYAGNAEPCRFPMRKNWFLNSDKEEKFEQDSGNAERILLKNKWEKVDGTYQKEFEEGVYRTEFSLIVNEDNANRRNMAESIKFDLESIGLKINIVPLPYDEYIERISSGNYELFIGSVMLSEELDFRFLLGQGNMFGYNDETMQTLLWSTQAANGKNSIVKAYKSLKDRFDKTLPIIGLCFENSEVLYSDKIGGELKSSQNNIYNGMFNLYVKEN